MNKLKARWKLLLLYLSIVLSTAIYTIITKSEGAAIMLYLLGMPSALVFGLLGVIPNAIFIYLFGRYLEPKNDSN